MISATEHEAIVDALNLLLELRNLTPYRGRGWWILNNAMCHIDDYFWANV